jgi:hypothetical protein
MPDGMPLTHDLRARIGHFRQKPVDMVRGCGPPKRPKSAISLSHSLKPVDSPDLVHRFPSRPTERVCADQARRVFARYFERKLPAQHLTQRKAPISPTPRVSRKTGGFCPLSTPFSVWPLHLVGCQANVTHPKSPLWQTRIQEMLIGCCC